MNHRKYFKYNARDKPRPWNEHTKRVSCRYARMKCMHACMHSRIDSCIHACIHQCMNTRSELHNCAHHEKKHIYMVTSIFATSQEFNISSNASRRKWKSAFSPEFARWPGITCPQSISDVSRHEGWRIEKNTLGSREWKFMNTIVHDDKNS